MKGGMTKESLVDFLKENIFGKYKDNLIILDNAGSHRNECETSNNRKW